MSRLLATVGCDFRLQWRYGFFLAGAVVVVFWIPLLRLLSDRETLGAMVPAFVFGNLTVTTFYFVAALLFFEKAEGSQLALAVTPLRSREVLLSKIATLTVLAGVETLLVVLLVYPGELRWLPLTAGMVLMAAMYTLFGFLAAVRFASITDFLIPSSLAVGVLQLPPLLDYFGVWSHWVVYLWPPQAGLVVLRGAVAPLAPWEAAYGLLYSVASLAVLGWLATAAHRRFIVQAQGGPAR